MEKRILKKLQMAELDILDEIVRVCNKNEIKYFLIGGTLIGAVRHQGFIPWDDDIDICMLREDYEKFIKIAPNELKEKYKIVNYKTEKNAYLSYTKVVNKNTTFTEKNAKYFKGHNSIWVDIFPLDSIDKINKMVMIKNKFINLIGGVIVEKKLKMPINSNKIIVKLFSKILKLLPNKILFKIINIIINPSFKVKKYVISYFSTYSDINQNVYLYDDIFPLIELKFEGKKYCVPQNYDNILKTTYGNYMEIPPKEKQITHNPLKIIFEDGEEIDFENERIKK